LAFEIIVKGLKGGHSGMDIHLERGNANKIMNRLLDPAREFGLIISEINGGSLRNAIPRESISKIVVNSEEYLQKLDGIVAAIKNEFIVSEPNLNIEVNKIESPKEGVSAKILQRS
jgi:dipeptidase D